LQPRLTYRGGRFYLIATTVNETNQTAQLLLSVSPGSSVLGTWCNYSVSTLRGSGPTLSWGESPSLGVTTNRLYVGLNHFRFSDEEFSEAVVLVFNKANLDSCAATTPVVWDNFANEDASPAFSIQPAVDYDEFGATVAYFVNSKNASSSDITVWRLENPNPGPGTLERFTINTLPYDIPPDADQPGTGTKLGTSDARILNASKRHHVLWVAHNTARDPGSCVIASAHWMAITAPASTTSPPTIQQEGYYDAGCGLHYFYPAIMPDVRGVATMVFNTSGTSQTPDIRITGRELHTPANTMKTSATVFASGSFTETSGRWGELSGISVDPSNQKKIYVTAQYTKANDVWGTRIARTQINGTTPNAI
jgi:hypothetical protein